MNQQIRAQLALSIVLDENGVIHASMKGQATRAMINMLVTTAHQDFLRMVEAQEKKASNGPSIAIALPGSEVERNPKA